MNNPISRPPRFISENFSLETVGVLTIKFPQKISPAILLPQIINHYINTAL